ncbi:LOW QUALITY PROTEIN: carcinoembryonic antigen-related cell adhesion molecule 1-like [Dromiciops gliroides]|uniref:LOW QUALITY PROTEIN: carcinoembryonic antigen-related cell adhesion molecule 1-like n=1 Tax=Dromiciops gliroides TaxID=33562 RepID=UPI001CC683DC|nr:LOW QUALITY PROTEIN: carcinoembryonic antigen-related cell adhesion molecule 1-like [Dromiciops gliroides]
MQRTSETPHSGGSPWKGLLITASIFSCWIQPTSTQAAPVTIVPSPPYGTVGSRVILDIQGFSEQALSYTWFRKEIHTPNLITVYSVSSGVQTPANIREKVLPKGSLVIPDLTLSDNDLYIVQIIYSRGLLSAVARGHLTVYGPLSKPTINSTNMAPVENKVNVSLTCQSKSQDITYLWFISQSPPAGDRMVLSPDNNKTPTIIHVMREDQRPYECEIWNPASVKRSDPFTLNITYGPDTPMILPTDSHCSIGVILELLLCHGAWCSTGQYIWLISGMQMVSTPQLYIPNVSLNHTATYTCNASNLVTGLSNTTDINITTSEKPAKPRISVKSTNVIENGTLFFTCSTENEGMNILWFFSNTSLLPSERMNMSENNQTLIIKSVKREDTGSYQCEVWNPIGANRSDPLTLTVNYGPDHIMFLPNLQSEEIEVKFNVILILMCQVESYPPALYEWQINGTKNSDFSYIPYIIKNASWEDSGKYTCLAKNDVTKLSISKDVTIKVVDLSPGKGNGSSLSGGAIAGIVIGVLAGEALIQTLLYFLLFRKTERDSKYQLSEKNCSAPKHGEDTTVYENNVFPKVSALPTQTLDISRVDVYDKINPCKDPQA